MKIKTKKQLNLPQLIEWAWENDIRNKGFESERTSRAYFDYNGYLSCTRAMEPKDTFTITTEEEITEDTVFELMIEILDGTPNCLWERASVKDWKDEDSKEFHAYIDGEFKCIWRDGKLVE